MRREKEASRRKEGEWIRLLGHTAHKKGCRFSIFASCQKHSLLDENAEKASKPDKNGKSMKRKFETVSLFCMPKGRRRRIFYF